VRRAAVIRDPTVAAGSGGFAAIQTVAASSGVELIPVGVHDAEEIETGIADFARGHGGPAARWTRGQSPTATTRSCVRFGSKAAAG
jgi:hypothetical protein